MKKILFVLSGHATMGGGKPAGCYFPEMVHPYYAMKEHGISVEFTSPGENGPVLAGTDSKDPKQIQLLSDVDAMNEITSAPKPETLDPGRYDAIFYTGGHGGMFDFPDNKALINIAETIYANGGYVTAMCHGPAGLINLKRASGKYMVQGHKVTGYSREEEVFYDTLLDIPFVLGEKLDAHGGKYSSYGINQGYVVKDRQIITGQNPMSSQLVGEAIAKALRKK
ncbi:MAG: type 1 glutamine amidotransferase domain-containing protein [Desulfovibrio sp.]